MGRVRKYSMDGLTLGLSDWAKLYGIPTRLVYNRVINHSWELRRALTEPKHHPTDRRNKRKPQKSRELRPSRKAPGCRYPDCFHCSLPDCFSD